MARPTKLTKQLTRTVCEHIESGMSIAGACALAGIGESTYHEWVSRGVAGDAGFVEFAEQTARARARVEMRLLESVEWAAGERVRRRALGGGENFEIDEYIERDWKAAAWLLERKFPGEYGSRSKVEHSGPGGGAITILQLAELAAQEQHEEGE